MSSTKKAAYAPDGTEITWDTTAKWDVAGITKTFQGRWQVACVGSTPDSVRTRVRAWYNRRENLAAWDVCDIWETTAPIVREYFGSHRVNIARVFKPGQGGWADVKLHAGRSNIRKLSKQGVTSIEFCRASGIEARDGRGIGDAQFQMEELLKSMRLPKQKMCATVGHESRPATHKISYTYRNEGPRQAELVCSSCATSYSRRPVLTGFESAPLAA